MPSGNHSDAQIAQYQKEIEERSAFIEGTTANAHDQERDLTPTEMELIKDSQKRIEQVEEQLKVLEDAQGVQRRARQRAEDLQNAMSSMRREVDKGAVEYRSAGHYLSDYIMAQTGSKQARERLEVFERAAAHQKTPDNLGVIPDPIVGDVINFIDAARPIVSFLGPRDLPSATFYRPKVTQLPNVAVQGSAGAAADEKSELVSQKMLISRLTGNAVTYGGYVNVSRQNIDFSSPQIMDLVIEGLAADYAVETESATATALNTGGTTSVLATNADGPTTLSALWTAVANVYSTVKGAGRLFLALGTGRLAQFGSLFNPYPAVNPGLSSGFLAGQAGQGILGSVSGIPVLISAGLPSTAAILASTASTEVYEQRVGALQATEPSVLGVQVAYAGYFTVMTIEANGKHRFTTS